jgi:predicted ATPase
VIFLRSLELPRRGREDAFPFTVPAIAALESLTFETAVTFLVGENGSGKSTLLESLAIATGLAAVAATSTRDDATLAAQRKLASKLKLAWSQRTHRGFFLRAEDFFGFTKSIAHQKAALRERAEEINETYRERSDYARGLALGPVRASLGEFEQRYGADLDANSHGQAFFQLFRSRFTPGGLYLLDEPETPLSPQSQLGLLAMMKDMVEQQAQFIIATHSPILLAFPGATILNFDITPIARAEYGELEHVRLTREFLQDPERFLRKL